MLGLVWEAGSGADTESAQTAPASGLLQAGLLAHTCAWRTLVAQALRAIYREANAFLSSEVALDQLWRRLATQMLMKLMKRHRLSPC